MGKGILGLDKYSIRGGLVPLLVQYRAESTPKTKNSLASSISVCRLY